MALIDADKNQIGLWKFGSWEKVTITFRNLLLKLIPNLQSQRFRTSVVPRVVVLVNWGNMGDFILFSAVIRETKLNFPDSKLIVVAQRENAELGVDCPYVDKWIWIKGHRNPRPGEGHGKETGYARKLAVTYFYLLFHGKRRIDFLLGPDWLLVASLNQFVQSILFRKANQKDLAATFGGSIVLSRIQDQSHQVTRMCSIIEAFNLAVTSDEIENWLPVISRTGEGQGDIASKTYAKQVLVSLGAGQTRRNWPLGNVENLIESLLREHQDLGVKILGPKSLATDEVFAKFSNTERTKNLVGQTNLAEIKLLMGNSDLLISNDSGLVHLAATLKLPTVVISAHSTDADPWNLHSPNRYHPWKTEYRVIQPAKLIPPCKGSCQAPQAHCIEQVHTDSVFRACNDLLNIKS